MKALVFFTIIMSSLVAQAKVHCEIVRLSNNEKIFYGEIPGSETMLLTSDKALHRPFNLGHLQSNEQLSNTKSATLISVVTQYNGRRVISLGTLDATNGYAQGNSSESIAMGSSFEALSLIAPAKDLMVSCATYGAKKK